ncbi:MAG: SDR family NAD(P)-dependent oxidoreductase [Humibacillus sp.]|nr:SDR family NAD(P)-dependent oxidoreductase [Humibacillus sp.]MDN5779899.1 SDR family NAD(P)-dependent oxidoreductase [Humibacillus sp.]
MTPLAGQVAIVTGGGKGLGRAFALHLAALGAAVVVNNRNRIVGLDGRGAADHVVEEILVRGGRAVADHGDVSDPATAEALVEAAISTWGRLDICVTSAAITGPQLFHRTTAENFAHVIDINVAGTALVAAAALRVMREAGHGRIIMVASTAGLHGEPTVAAYAASKGAIIALGRTVASEGRRRGVLTNVLLPYATTQMTEGSLDPQQEQALRPELVAPVVAALADPASTTNGQVIIAAGSGLRVADAVEGATVSFPDQALLPPAELDALLASSRAGTSHTYPDAQAAFQDFASELARPPRPERSS